MNVGDDPARPQEVELEAGGARRDVTEENKVEYVEKLVAHKLNRELEAQMLVRCVVAR